MNHKDRRELEKQKMFDLILSTAGQIIKKDGIDQLSIRKIAEKIGYSPTTIYYYFPNKEEIVNKVIMKDYQRLMHALSDNIAETDSPEEKFKMMLCRYINMALKMPDEYKMMMLNDSPSLLEHTSVLGRGASEKRPAIGMLCKSIKELLSNPNIDDSVIEKLAQAVWTSIFGIIIRLILENIPNDQQNELIDEQVNLIMNGLISRKSSNN